MSNKFFEESVLIKIFIMQKAKNYLTKCFFLSIFQN